MSTDLSLLGTGVSRFSGQRGRTADGTNKSGVRYPSPFFDIGQTYLPTSIKSLLQWCRFYFLTNPLINTTIFKMSEYPITEIIIDEQNKQIKEKWEELLGRHLRYRAFQIEVGLDYFTYGLSAVTIHFPFTKYLICTACNHKDKASNINYKWRGLDYIITCPKCSHSGPAKIQDYNERDIKRIRLQRWNPEYIHIDAGFGGADPIYTFQLPIQLKNDIIMGKKNVLDTVPDIFIESLKRNKYIKFTDDNLFVFKRPMISQGENGWGMPLIFPVLKDVYYLQILRKAQECVTPDTLIETETGLIKAKDINIGDIVRTHLGRWRKVENKWEREAKELEVGTKITLSGIRPLPSTYSPGHPILTLRRNTVHTRKDTKNTHRSSIILKNPHLWEEVLCPASQFKSGDYTLYPRKLPSAEQIIDIAKYADLVHTESFVYSAVSLASAKDFEVLENGGNVAHTNSGRVAKRLIKAGSSPNRMARDLKLTEDLAYVLGWYLGDGSCGSRHVMFSLGLSNNYHKLLDSIKSSFGVDATVNVSKNVRTITVCDTLVKTFVKGFIPGTARDKKIPREILDSTDECKLSFLKGLFEADGYINSRVATLATSSTDIAYGTYRLLLHLGCIPTIGRHVTPETTLKDGRKIRSSDGYHVTVVRASRDRLVSLWNKEEAKVIVSGKSGFFWKDYFASRVSKVEKVEEKTYIDFRIEEDTTFCTPGSATKNCIALEHIVPLRVIFPQAGGASSDPYSSVNLDSWKFKMENEIAKFRMDPNHIPVLPLPIGQEVIGGDGKALMLYQEMQAWSDQVVAGMGVPRELLYGGASFSGSNVQMRMLENSFLGYRIDHENMLNNFVIRRIANYMGWPTVRAHMRRFKMADDLQRLGLYFQLNQAQKISDQTLLQEADQDPTIEEERKELELTRQLDYQRKMQIAQAHLQADVQSIQIKAQQNLAPPAQPMQPPMGIDPNQPQEGMPPQMPGQPPMAGQEGAMMPGNQVDPAMPEGSTVSMENAQQAPQEGIPTEMQSPLTVGQKGGGVNLLYMARRAATAIGQMDQVQQTQELNKMKSMNPQLYMLVIKLINSEKGSQADPLDPLQSPLPEQKPSRRVAPVGV